MTSLEEVVKEFWRLIDMLESKGSGHLFYPTRLEISSCRSIDLHRLGILITEMKSLVGAKERLTTAELAKLNNPDACPTCNGTGDRQNHERDSNPCYDCDGTGSIDQ